jgi:glycosyltransferase involved in cell wall biosynthesis
MRIGIWCDYGVTLTPTEGIGVFVANLVSGLLELNEPLEVVLLIRPGDHHLVESLGSRFPDRLQIVPPRWPEIPAWPAVSNVIQGSVRLVSRIQRKAQSLQRRWHALKGNAELGMRNGESTFNIPHSAFRIPHSHWPLANFFNPLVVCEQAACDVWLIPSVRFRYPLRFPSVLVVHDLVHIHYPDAVPDDVRAELHRVVPPRAAEATLCACMSGFIRDVDLHGVLRLPEEKIRLIRPAPPSDFPNVSREEALRLKPARLNRPYIFYPAAFRSYKNHVALVDALHVLRQNWREESFDLVFTGIHALPKDLARRIAELGLHDRVHVLGCVDRPTLAGLYQCAFATIVPSLYEQGSFPIYEALHWGCPVACSNIPSLVEQCRPLGDAMIYFDPKDPEAIARAIIRFCDDRETILARQQAAKKHLWQRTWRDAAREWLGVFREAICRSDLRHQTPIRRSA